MPRPPGLKYETTMGPAELARALNGVFGETDASGRPRYDRDDIHRVRHMFLLDIARRGEAEQLDESGRIELAALFALLEIDEGTPPEQIEPRVQAYLTEPPIAASLLKRVAAVIHDADSGRDGVESQRNFERWTGRRTTSVGPVEGDGEEPNAQAWARSLGFKVRI